MPDDRSTVEAEAAAFRRLREHLLARADVQNINLMNLAGFCRNCLADWLREASESAGHPMTKAEGRERFYGMPYEAWRERNQREASPEAVAAFAGRDRTQGDGGG